MPATFPSHAAAVLPLKLWRPHWHDGVALVIGSMAPDLAYAMDGFPLEHPVRAWPPLWYMCHTFPWLLLWVPVIAVPLSLAVRWAAPTVAVHLPRPWRGYASIRRRVRWWVTVISATVGGASHALWDWIAVGVWDLASSVVGGAVAIALFVYFGRKVSVDGPPRRPVAFWVTAVLVFGAIAATLPFLAGASLPHTTSARLILAVTAALLMATAVCGIARRRIT